MMMRNTYITGMQLVYSISAEHMVGMHGFQCLSNVSYVYCALHTVDGSQACSDSLLECLKVGSEQWIDFRDHARDSM